MSFEHSAGGQHRVSVRPVTPGDAQAWERMRQALWPSAPGEHRGEIAAFFNNGPSDIVEALLAIDGRGQPIGFAELSIRSHAEGCRPGRIAYLEGWYVEPAHRRRGVGRALVAAAEDWARRRGCADFASDTEMNNEVSQSAHRGLGFTEAGRIVCFVKRLR